MSEESDLKALGEFFKERRQERWENFIQNYVPKLEAKNIEFEIEEGVKIIINNNGEKIDFFPKKNRILFRKSNQWKNNGISEIEKILK